MQTVKVRASTEYDVLIERGILKRAGELIKEYTGAGRALLITDRTVDGLYSKAALESLKSAGITARSSSLRTARSTRVLKQSATFSRSRRSSASTEAIYS